MDKGWFLYQGALLPSFPPHQIPNLPKEEILLMLRKHKGYFCRWTTDFDCKKKTEWWYCIKDEEINLSLLTSKCRYRINHGLKNYNILRISDIALLNNYVDRMYFLEQEKIATYPKKYRPKPDFQKFKSLLEESLMSDADLWIAISDAREEVDAFSITNTQDDVAYLSLLRVAPWAMNTDVNAAMVYTICNHYIVKEKKKYICDGERNIRHETNFQEYLIKNLGFRYAYCKLHIVYNPIINLIVKIMFPFKSIIRYLGNYNKLFYNISCVLKQEEIAKTFR